MREAIGSTFLYNIIFLFIIITFGFLAATISYMKAFKMNGAIANSLEKYEGYNTLSQQEIEKSLTTLGYRFNSKGNLNCPEKTHDGKRYSPILEFGTDYKYCVYEYPKYNGYFTYGILTYIYMDVPVVGGTFSIPVYSETEQIYEFSQR